MKFNTLHLALSGLCFIIALLVLSTAPSYTSQATSTNSSVAYLFTLFISIILLMFSAIFFTLYFRYDRDTKIVGIIPARMASSRFPGKPLAKINGVSMLLHIWKNAKMCTALDEVYVATPDKKIFDFMEKLKLNAKTIMTSNKHNGCIDRVVEALQKIEKKTGKKDIIVLIQGDEPMVTPSMIDKAIQPVVLGVTQVTNLMGFIKTKKEAQDKNTIKVVTDKHNNALYMSRLQIPYRIVGQKQVCVMAFTRDMLYRYKQLHQAILETTELIDMLRFIENNIQVKMIEVDEHTHAIDVPTDIKIVEQLMKK